MEGIKDNILSLDNRIFYVGFLDKAGNILEGKYKVGTESLFPPNELQKFTLEVAIRRRMREEWDNTLGKVLATVVARDRVTIATFYVGERTLLILIERGAPLGILDPVDYLRYYLHSIQE